MILFKSWREVGGEGAAPPPHGGSIVDEQHDSRHVKSVLLP